MSSCEKTVKYHPAACAMMLDHTSQSKQQKRSRPTRKQNKEPFVNTLLTIKIACAEKEWSQNNGSVFCLTACIRVWSEWFERRSYRSRHIFAQPFTTYLCLSSPSESYSSRREAGIIFQCKWHSLGQSASWSWSCLNANLPSVSIPFSYCIRALLAAIRLPLLPPGISWA